MQPYRGESETVEVSETDIGLMESVHNAFNLCPQLKSGLPSMLDDIKSLISHRFTNRESARSLEQLVAEEGGHNTTMKAMLADMLVAVIKETKSKRGKSDPVYSEEIEMMFEQEFYSQQNRLAQCMGEIV